MNTRIEQFRADRDTLVSLAEYFEGRELTHCGKVWSHEEAEQTDGDGGGDDVGNPASIRSFFNAKTQHSQPEQNLQSDAEDRESKYHGADPKPMRRFRKEQSPKQRSSTETSRYETHLIDVAIANLDQVFDNPPTSCESRAEEEEEEKADEPDVLVLQSLLYQ